MCLVSPEQMPFQQKKCLLRMNQGLIEWLLVSGLIQSFTCTCVCARPESVRVNKPPSQSVARGDTPWLHFSVCPRRGPPSPLPPLTTATTNMQAGRRLTHLDHLPPPSASRYSPVVLATSLLALWHLHHHSSAGPSDSLTTSALFPSPHSSQNTLVMV